MPQWGTPGYVSDSYNDGVCRPLTIATIHVPGSAVRQACQHNSERYGTIQRCGSRVFSIARIEQSTCDQYTEYATVLRVRDSNHSNEWRPVGMVGASIPPPVSNGPNTPYHIAAGKVDFASGWESFMSLNAAMYCLANGDIAV
jgi:hypothetical protein